MAKQIYDIVNSTVSQTTGRTDIAVIDEQGLIALGNTVLSDATTMNNFISTLVNRIGKTIYAGRTYENQFESLVVDDFEWGAILQKLSVQLPSAEADESVDLTNDVSVDAYKVKKPVAVMKLFTSETPYQYRMTFHLDQLKRAFTSESAMGSFIQLIYQQISNAITLGLENLARNTLGNFIAEVAGGTREIKLVTLYNAETGETLTAASALTSEKFLRFAIRKIKSVSRKMTYMSTLYNDGTIDRFTPKDKQRLFVLDEFNEALETNVMYAAFNDDYLKLGDFKEVGYWQAVKTPNQVKVKKASGGTTAVTVSNVVATLTDHDACGIYKKDEMVLTTPVNAAGKYFNTFWHQMNLYFNDLSENGVIFTLN